MRHCVKKSHEMHIAALHRVEGFRFNDICTSAALNMLPKVTVCEEGVCVWCSGTQWGGLALRVLCFLHLVCQPSNIRHVAVSELGPARPAARGRGWEGGS